MDTIDGHLHLFKEVSERYPRALHELTPPEREHNAEEFLGFMAEAGVDKAVVVPVSEHDHYLKDVLAEYPDRFAGVGVFDPEVEDPVADLERRVTDVGIQGMRLFNLGDPEVAPRSQPLFPLLERMRDLDLKVWFYAAPEQVELMDRILEELPGLVVVMNHLGFCPDLWAEMAVDEHGRPRFDVELPPATLPLIARIAEHPTVYCHLSGQYAFTKEEYPYDDLRPVVEEIYRIFGAHRMLWASDYPWIGTEPGYAKQLALVDHYFPGISAAERDAIRGGTAASLFRFA